MTTTPRRLAALAVGLILFLTACSRVGNGDAESSSDSAATDAPMIDESPASGESAAADDAGGASADQGSSVDFAVAAENRQIVSRGTINVRVDDLDAAMEEIQVLVDDVDGLVFAEETDLRDGAVTRITLKVPPTAFRAALASLADLGEVQTQTVSTDDVTEQVVDLDSRIATAEASVERLRALILRADDIADIAVLESELLNRETTLETLRGQRRTIGDQVALATITVTLTPTPDSPDTPQPEPDELPGFLDALGGGWDALVKVATVVGLVLFALLPWLPMVLVVWAVVHLARRRHHRRQPAGGGSGSGSGSAGGGFPPPPPTAPAPPAPSAPDESGREPVGAGSRR